MQQTIEVANIMCGGCASTIKRELGLLEGVSEISVDVAAGKVSFDAAGDRLDAISSRLGALGYPEKRAPAAASSESLADIVAKAKTYAR